MRHGYRNSFSMRTPSGQYRNDGWVFDVHQENVRLQVLHFKFFILWRSVQLPFYASLPPMLRRTSSWTRGTSVHPRTDPLPYRGRFGTTKRENSIIGPFRSWSLEMQKTIANVLLYKLKIVSALAASFSHCVTLIGKRCVNFTRLWKMNVRRKFRPWTSISSCTLAVF